jgi:hypothetical protein
MKSAFIALVVTVSFSSFSSKDMDPGDKVNEQFTHCFNACAVTLPDGVTTYASTIKFPCTTMLASPLAPQASLLGGNGTVLNYTGKGIAIDADCANSKANVKMRGFRIHLSPAASSGIRLRGFNRGDLEDIIIDGGGVQGKPDTGADGILIEAANSITLRNVTLHGNRNGLRNVGGTTRLGRASANGIFFVGGEVDGNAKCGVLEDGYAASRESLMNRGNSYSNLLFESNGSNGFANTGHMCLQTVYGATISNNYFEYGADQKVPYSIWIGDDSSNAKIHPIGVTITGNSFISANSAATIRVFWAQNTTIAGNTEWARSTSFVEHSDKSRETALYPNTFENVKSAETNPLPGVVGNYRGIQRITAERCDDGNHCRSR